MYASVRYLWIRSNDLVSMYILYDLTKFIIPRTYTHTHHTLFLHYFCSNEKGYMLTKVHRTNPMIIKFISAQNFFSNVSWKIRKKLMHKLFTCKLEEKNVAQNCGRIPRKFSSASWAIQHFVRRIQLFLVAFAKIENIAESISWKWNKIFF
jgi:hypothetical protein